MNEIVNTSTQLPDTLEDLSKFVLIGREKLVAVRAEIRAIQKVHLAREVYEQKLSEAQDIAEAVIDAEVRVGELTMAIETAQGERTDLQLRDSGKHKLTKKDRLKELGISEGQVKNYESLAKNPQAVEKAKARARDNNEVVTRSAVMKEIKASKQKDRDKPKEPEKELDRLQYFAEVFFGKQ